MKKIAPILLLLFCSIAIGQQKGEVVLNWTEKSAISYGDFKVTVPQFNPENFEFKSNLKLLFFNIKIPQSSKIDENSLTITNVVYEAISISQMGDLSYTSISNTLNASLRNIKGRDKMSVLLTLSPIVKDESGYKKVMSFTYTFNSISERVTTLQNNFSTLSNSVLATGEWYRFYIEKSGAYIINKQFFQELGINMNLVDPKKIKIYGNGGRMIPLKNSDFYPSDLTENAIQVIGETDGFFNDGDYVLFYGEGVDNWTNESKTTQNLYTNKSYYYINVKGAEGKRIPDMIQPTSNSIVTINTFDDYKYHEIDAVNIGRLGRRWFGEKFDVTNEQEFNFVIPNIDTSTPVKIELFAAGESLAATSFKIEANNQNIGTINFSPISEFILFQVGQLPNNTTIPASENIKVKLTYENNGVPGSTGYLDYIFLKSKRSLKGYGKQFRFQYDLSNTTIGIGEYQISNASNIKQIWNITDIYNVNKIENTGAQSTLAFKADLGQLQKYIAIDYTDLYLPLKDPQSRIFNQNLKGTIFNNAQGQFQDIDYVIVTPFIFISQAERLANFHRSYSQLNVKVVTLESLYHEFSSGKQDIGAIRNFMKYVYFNASAPEKRVKYLNLFGDASYDFKNRISKFSNYVPIYHALTSNFLSEASFASDDYFGLMDNNEGNVDSSSDDIDIAVGRMIANSNQQAAELVNKVIDYHDIKSYGNWRNNYVCIADDPDPAKTDDRQLQFFQNRLADRIGLEKPFLNVNKILLDSYFQESSSGGNRYPKARKDFFNAFEKGSLVFNYLGHGGEDGLSQERIYEKLDGQTLNNRYKYPLFITITCDFSRFDNPFRPTAGEYTYWNPRGGAISMITTTREIGQGTGQSFNDKLASFLFSYGSNQYTSMADALRLAKNDFSSPTRIVFYIGDPAIMLAIPKPKIRLTKVNDVSISQPIDDFKSLAYVKLSGEVLDEFNNALPTYNGELAIQIYDKPIIKSTLKNDNVSALISLPNVLAETMPFVTLGETIFRGNATITNGQFEFGFVVPRDITIPVGNGRISFYSKRGQLLFDKSGYDTAIKIGGINLDAVADNLGPKVKLYMNDQTFISGGITNESPIFLAFLEDENGINTASGIGHDIVAILDGNESNPIKLNDYYETELDNYKKGKLKFPFRNLTKGIHTLTFKAWDVYNNIVTADIQFLVVGDESITISNVLNYPNPFVNHTQFWFSHNKPSEPLEVQIQVMTITGKIVWTKNQTIATDGFLSKDLVWDGKDDFGDKIGKGVYIYKLTVKSLFTGSKTEKYEKLVIL